MFDQRFELLLKGGFGRRGRVSARAQLQSDLWWMNGEKMGGFKSVVIPFAPSLLFIAAHLLTLSWLVYSAFFFALYPYAFAIHLAMPAAVKKVSGVPIRLPPSSSTCGSSGTTS